jgi:hypothetical protein
VSAIALSDSLKFGLKILGFSNCILAILSIASLAVSLSCFDDFAPDIGSVLRLFLCKNYFTTQSGEEILFLSPSPFFCVMDDTFSIDDEELIPPQL